MNTIVHQKDRNSVNNCNFSVGNCDSQMVTIQLKTKKYYINSKRSFLK